VNALYSYEYNLFNYENLDKLYNLFSKSIKINKQTPNLSNSDFIRTIKQTFGLTLYLDTQRNEIELSFIKDIFQSDYIDLNKYLLNNETYISESEESEFVYELPPVTDNEIDDDRLIAEVYSIGDLNEAILNYGKLAFVKSQNKYVESVKIGDAIQNWIYKYIKYSGNNKTITDGEGEKQEISPSVLIPNMKDIDSNIGATDIILEIDKTGISPLISTGTTDFELILINCTGLKTLTNHINNVYYKYDGASLVDTNVNKYDLCVTGENSIGENFIKPWLELLNHESVTHKFLFDIKTFLEVWQLLKPQNKPTEQQTRWVMVESVKLLPKKITFQFTEGKDYILAEIEFAKPRV
jgi:hypothetical protein